MDHGPAQPGTLHLSIGCHPKDGRKGELVLMWPERTELVGDAFWQHGIHPIGKIHRSSPRIRLLVEGRLRFYIVADVSDMDADLQFSLIHAAQRYGIIK